MAVGVENMDKISDFVRKALKICCIVKRHCCNSVFMYIPYLKLYIYIYM